MATDANSMAFEIDTGFDAGQAGGGLELGPYADHYRQLFAEALDDGVITAEERERLNRAAANLGMDREALAQLERAMIGAHEAHHHAPVVQAWQAGAAKPARPQGIASDDAERRALVDEIGRLQAHIERLEDDLREARAHVNVEIDLSEVEEFPTLDEPADRLRARIVRDPTNAKLFASLFEACRKDGDVDGQSRAAQALRVLGAAGPEHEQLAGLEPSGVLINPRRSLSAENWFDELSHPDLAVVTSNILSVVTPAALVGRAASLQRDKKLPPLDESARHDVKTTTVSAVRALGWAATVLGLPAPVVQADTSRAVAYAHVPAMPPWSLLGSEVLSGRKPREHAFLAGRHVAYYRAEFFARVLFPDVEELEDLFLSALLLGNPALPIAEHLKNRVKPLSDALSPLLDAAQSDQLRRQFKAFVAGGGRTSLSRWSEGVDKTAARAGLLLCDDLSVAAELLRREEGPEGPLLNDLLGFSVSESYRALRRQLGITAN